MTPQTSDQQSTSQIAAHIREQLQKTIPNDTIHLCGTAPLSILSAKSDKVLQLATQKLHTWPYQQVPIQWRRLFEEASLHIVASLLDDEVKVKKSSVENEKGTKRRRLDVDEPTDDWLGKVVQVLDRAVIMSGAPGRKTLIDAILEQLDSYISPEALVKPRPSQKLTIVPPEKLETQHEITHSPDALDFEAFQQHLDTSTTPLIIPDSFDHWPAKERWSDLAWLKLRTVNGNRLVPVEIGTSYNEEDWTQKIMTMSQFIDEFLLPPNPAKIGYLAQHDLFTQIPSLKDDIRVPDYCYTTPPEPSGAALRIPGLADTPDSEEPLMNAWLGPKGTKTPLHTDPYHNVLCQVVGYKYVRLYPPTETDKLYPAGIDDAGIDMSNTSRVDVQKARQHGGGRDGYDRAELDRLCEEFPLFADAEYEEAILAPGECLYIPLGYWHYVESLTASFSVSFWWN